MNRDEPPEEAYPEGLYRKFTFQFELDPETGNYTLFCPEWHCEIPCGQHPGHKAYGLCMEIAGHNTAEMREQADGNAVS
jgi:hypothetical protein